MESLQGKQLVNIWIKQIKWKIYIYILGNGIKAKNTCRKGGNNIAKGWHGILSMHMSVSLHLAYMPHTCRMSTCKPTAYILAHHHPDPKEEYRKKCYSQSKSIWSSQVSALSCLPYQGEDNVSWGMPSSTLPSGSWAFLVTGTLLNIFCDMDLRTKCVYRITIYFFMY